MVRSPSRALNLALFHASMAFTYVWRGTERVKSMLSSMTATQIWPITQPGGGGRPGGLRPSQFLGQQKQGQQSRFVSVALDHVLGPWGAVSAQKAISGLRELLGGMEEKRISRLWVIDLPARHINFFLPICPLKI